MVHFVCVPLAIVASLRLTGPPTTAGSIHFFFEGMSSHRLFTQSYKDFTDWTRVLCNQPYSHGPGE